MNTELKTIGAETEPETIWTGTGIGEDGNVGELIVTRSMVTTLLGELPRYRTFFIGEQYVWCEPQNMEDSLLDAISDMIGDGGPEKSWRALQRKLGVSEIEGILIPDSLL